MARNKTLKIQLRGLRIINEKAVDVFILNIVQYNKGNNFQVNVNSTPMFSTFFTEERTSYVLQSSSENAFMISFMKGEINVSAFFETTFGLLVKTLKLFGMLYLTIQFCTGCITTLIARLFKSWHEKCLCAPMIWSLQCMFVRRLQKFMNLFRLATTASCV